MWANQFHQNPPRPRVGSISTLYKPVFNHATLISKIKLELAAGTEWQIFLSFSSVSLVWVPPTRRHFQYPCPKFEFTALLYNIYNAYILKQRSMGQLQKCTFSLPKWVQNTHRAPGSPPYAEIPENVNGWDITSSILHFYEIHGALNWVES